MKEYFDEDEYLEDIYGDEIKIGEGFYRIKSLMTNQTIFLVHEKNFIEYAEERLELKLEER